MSNALPPNCKRLQGAPAIYIDPIRWSIKRPASHTPVCEQVADTADGAPCNRLPGNETIDALVVGGGFYGCCLALLLRGYLDRVILVEKESDLLLRASAINQARVHTGYHYPRNLVTAYRSFVNFPRFVFDFRKAIMDDFVKLYAIARRGSKVNAMRFHQMFKEMGAPIKPASAHYKKLFNQDLIEDVFQVTEVAFDAVKLREILRQRLLDAGVIILLETEVAGLASLPDERLEVTINPSGERIAAKRVFNCTYSLINKLLRMAGTEMLPLKHEVTEMALVRLPEALQNIGVTVMDGPFFSTMPYPSRKLHTLSHVRYTPHTSWTDKENFTDGHQFLARHRPASNYLYMLRDSQRYLPLLAETEYVDSLFEIKTVLLQNEVDDGRPILFKQDFGMKGLHTIMGSKIDNIYDVLEVIAEMKGALGLDRNLWRYLFPQETKEQERAGSSSGSNTFDV